MKWYELVRVWQGLCIRCTGSNPVFLISKLDLWSNWITGGKPKAKPGRGTFRQRLKQPLCSKCKDIVKGEDELLKRYRYATAIGMPHVEAATFAADAGGYTHAMKNGYEKVIYDASARAN